MNSLAKLGRAFKSSPNLTGGRPVLNQYFESNLPGIYVIGDLAGAPVVKLAIEQGHRVAQQIAAKNCENEPSGYDVIIAGSGAAGLSAALTAQSLGLRVLVLEKSRIANTIADFPEGKWIYAEPEDRPTEGKLWLEAAPKEELLRRWQEAVDTHRLEVRTGEGLAGITRRQGGGFDIQTPARTYRTRFLILATGQRGNPRKLGVPGEDGPAVYHRLYSPKQHEDEDILVVGGGNSAVEAALALAGKNRVTLSYRGSSFHRVFRENRRRLNEAIESGAIRAVLNSTVVRFENGSAVLDSGAEIAFAASYVLIGADLPADFLRSLGIRLENDWTGNPWLAAGLAASALYGLSVFHGTNPIGLLLTLAAVAGLITAGIKGSRFAWLGFSFLVCYTIYGAKQSSGHEFWPFTGWGYAALSFGGRPWSFWYTVLYTFAMTVFGIQAMRRWGFAKGDRFQIWRYVSLLGFQWIFFFLIPEFLFQLSVKYQWVGQALATDPNFASNAWRSYGLIYAWPLFFYTFFGAPHQVWIVWGALLSFVIIPVLVLFHGKRYCSWICGCGGLAETVGDRWRHLAPKGRNSIRWEAMNTVVMAAAVLVTLLVLGADLKAVFRKPAGAGLEYYHLIADVWLVGILPVTLYPFFGGKIWCRYWCPLAKMMQVFSAVFTRFRVSRFAIHANEKCIACGECTRNCQVGIDVMSFALRQDELNNANTSCIGCGICVTVCPMDVLSFQPQPASAAQLVQIAPAKGATLAR